VDDHLRRTCSPYLRQAIRSEHAKCRRLLCTAVLEEVTECELDCSATLFDQFPRLATNGTNAAIVKNGISIVES
jgi:hypothetical protein